MPRGVKKEHLPTKVCVTCGRPFTWRKVWEKCWDEVQCCSDRCKNERKRKLQLANRELRASGAQDADCTAHASPDATPTSDSKAVASTQHDLREAAACFEETPSSLKEDGAPRSPLLELPNDAMLAILHRMDAPTLLRLSLCSHAAACRLDEIPHVWRDVAQRTLPPPTPPPATSQPTPLPGNLLPPASSAGATFTSAVSDAIAEHLYR
ncbi:hypothetical protein Vafri_17721 [Volvox africanus]|uniref:F-box domain-containing protein n=1 Tax=Volvox africanus TaxID=51714 RepID=A0A8J4BK51_9CHLO|nr:hypothetical protein Vafri_17721 [Volvox africanus]